MKFLIPCIAALALLFGACGASHSYRNCDGAVWNTTYHIVYQSPVDMTDSIQAVMRQVDVSLSVFNDSSTVSRINRNDTSLPDNFFREVFEASRRINVLSYGAFDPTVGPLVDMWGFGRDRDSVRVISPEVIDSIMCRVGIDSCTLSADGHVLKKHPGTLFNFSAIAKGYGCDKIGEMFRRNNIDSYMIEIGGEIAAAGHNPNDSRWRIMIDAPVEGADTVIHQRMTVIEVTDCGVATSGNYRNYRRVDGRVVGHSINPFTGLPADNGVLSVTVVAPDCMTADALATACMVMRLDSARAMIERLPSTSALFVLADTLSADTARHWKLLPTPGFPVYQP